MSIENSNEQISANDKEVNENISQEQIIEPTETLNQTSEISKSEIQNMEVQKHPHHVTHKKKWGEYFLEFLMIFLAVTLGFFAENIREQRNNQEIEKRNVEIIVDNLKSDTAELSYVINGNIVRSMRIDSLVMQKQYDISDTNVLKQVINFYLNISTDYIFHSNDAALEQMKSSGSLRLVKSKQVLDSLFNYSHSNWLLNYDGEYYTRNSGNIHSVAAKLFDFVPLPGQQLSVPVNLKQKGDLIQEFYNAAVSINYQIRVYYLKLLQEQRVHASNLIELLEKEYHLQNE